MGMEGVECKGRRVREVGRKWIKVDLFIRVHV